MVPLRVEVWLHGQERADVPRLEIRDFSRRGFYFFSDLKRDLASTLNFAVLFRKPPAKREIDLVRGIAQIIRCEDVGSVRSDHFGIAAKIEETTYEVGDELAQLDERSD